MKRSALTVAALMLLTAPLSAQAGFGRRTEPQSDSSTHAPPRAQAAPAPTSAPAPVSGGFGRRHDPVPAGGSAHRAVPATGNSATFSSPPPRSAPPPAPVIYAAPAPAPRVYAPPAPTVYVPPAPVYLEPTPVYVSPPPTVVVEARPAYVEPVVVQPRPVIVAAAPPPPPVYLAPRAAPVAAVVEPVRPLPNFTLCMEGHGYLQGASAGLRLRAEGDQFGFVGNVTSMLTRDPLDGAAYGIFTYDAHLSYAMIRGEKARVRFELGVSGAATSDIGFAGPDLGVSGSFNLVGPLGVEASVLATPLPYRRLDATALVTLTFRPFEVHGGWKYLVLDDAGFLGERHVDTFSGPFVGCGFAF